VSARFTAGRENGHRRPKGYCDWRPQAKTRALLDQVQQVLTEYQDYVPLTVRQIFYRLVGGFGYEKTERAYERLAEALVRARRAWLIPFDHIRDDGVVVYPVEWYRDVEAFHETTAQRAREYRRDRQHGQSHTLELWTEAAGMAPQLSLVAHEYSIEVYSSGGFSSLTAVRAIVDRAVRQSSTVLLHVGDFDPSGESIFESVAADAVAFFEQDKILANQELVFERVALTAEQVAIHGLPTSPAKSSDSRSKSWVGETCQLEALAPDQLAGIVESSIAAWIDVDVYVEHLERENADRAELLGLPRGDYS
jgi:hypothetical protein